MSDEHRQHLCSQKKYVSVNNWKKLSVLAKSKSPLGHIKEQFQNYTYSLIVVQVPPKLND